MTVSKFFSVNVMVAISITSLVEHPFEAVIEILKTRFGEIPDSITATLDSREDALTLKTLLKEAVLAPSLEAFQGLLERERS